MHPRLRNVAVVLPQLGFFATTIAAFVYTSSGWWFLIISIAVVLFFSVRPYAFNGLDHPVTSVKAAEPKLTQSNDDLPSPFFVSQLPHPQQNTPLQVTESKGLILMYYENPITFGKATAGIEPPYKYPQVAIISEKGQPLVIVRSEQSASGDLMLCALEPNGKHSNLGQCPEGLLGEEFIVLAAEFADDFRRD